MASARMWIAIVVGGLVGVVVPAAPAGRVVSDMIGNPSEGAVGVVAGPADETSAATEEPGEDVTPARERTQQQPQQTQSPTLIFGVPQSSDDGHVDTGDDSTTNTEETTDEETHTDEEPPPEDPGEDEEPQSSPL